MKRKRFILITACFLFNLFIISSGFCNNLNSIGFYEISFEKNDVTNEEYDLGEKLFSNFAMYGLPEKFYIRKQANLILNERDIEKITIEQVKVYNDIKVCYNINFSLTQKSDNDLLGFSRINLNKKFAIKIDKSVFAVVTILSEVHSKMSLITICDKSLEEVLDSLSTIADDIVVEEGPVGKIGVTH